ncbi:beta-1,3-galactosyltransferase 5-like isoform X2 [Pyxicephalus adspersus]|uniref:beta-1,3-galactosyltransferase 5-like isoform X2 n=1 Tax=Pyxicephalus adspersus TaxID=30357 RepID=UPI003B5A1C9D
MKAGILPTMKIRIVLVLQAFLSVFVILFIAKKFLNDSIVPQNVQETPIQPQRKSVTLQDEAFSYHLNYSSFLSEFPYLQSYKCSVLLTPQPQLKQNLSIPFLVLAVKTHPQSTTRRSALRQTWAKEMVIEGYRVRPIFLMALIDSIGPMNIVEEESKTYNDILLWDFMEGHHNLSLKERCFLEWLHFNMPQVDYIFKGDDDEFVNPAALVRYIKEHGTLHSLHGAVQRHAVVLRSSKYEVSKTLFPNYKYPYFLSGGGFLFPRASVPLLYEASLKIPVFPLDDVYLGFLALAANLTMHDDQRFYVWGLNFDACRYQQALVVHWVKMETLVEIWKKVQEAKCHPNGTIIT